MSEHAFTMTGACQLFGISHSQYGHRSRLLPNAALPETIYTVAVSKRPYTYLRTHVLLR